MNGATIGEYQDIQERRCIAIAMHQQCAVALSQATARDDAIAIRACEERFFATLWAVVAADDAFVAFCRDHGGVVA